MNKLPGWKDKALFTPGPLTTSTTIKQAMLCDLGSRDTEFISTVRSVRQKLLALCSTNDDYTTILMQGSGTFGIEATLSSVIPPDGKLLILINGAYGVRMAQIAERHGISTIKMVYPENAQPSAHALETMLMEEPGITHVAVVHCETTTGLINPIEVYGEIVKRHRRVYIVDAMSSFGAYPIDLKAFGIDYLITSSNKCVEGVPGFSIILADTKNLQSTRGFARTVSLDLLAQWEGLEKDGQFRFTPPTHVILAFHQALLELEHEGGVDGRSLRYKENHAIAMSMMQEMGFKPYLAADLGGYIISSFYYPDHPNFVFRTFYERLSEKGHVIYPGKLSTADCFRIGHIGRLNASDTMALMGALRRVLLEMNVTILNSSLEATS